MNKVCTKCKEEKDIKYFEFRKDTLKYRNYCKKCNKGYITTLEEKREYIHNLFQKGLKECSKCNSIKNIDDFNNDKITITGKTSYCKECIKNKYSKDELKNLSYKSKYGITLDDYKIMYDKLKGCCEICLTYNSLLVVDHCHTTGKVRGLLCNNCNSGIGFFKDNEFNLNNAIKYLNK